MTATWIVILVITALAIYAASRTYCQVCSRGFAVFTVVGKLARPTIVCFRCWRTHHALERSRR